VETISTVIGLYKKLLVNVGRYSSVNVFGDFLAKRGIERHVVKADHPEARR
jgi:hypothetical protein